MMPPVFPILNGNSAVKALLGSQPLRVYPWGQAPQNVARPYVTYGVYNGQPENQLDPTPQIDNIGTQIDIWGDSAKSCHDCFVAIRDALEPLAHMTTYQAQEKDSETQLFRARMEFDFWIQR